MRVESDPMQYKDSVNNRPPRTLGRREDIIPHLSRLTENILNDSGLSWCVSRVRHFPFEKNN